MKDNEEEDKHEEEQLQDDQEDEDEQGDEDDQREAVLLEILHDLNGPQVRGGVVQPPRK